MDAEWIPSLRMDVVELVGGWISVWRKVVGVPNTVALFERHPSKEQDCTKISNGMSTMGLL